MDTNDDPTPDPYIDLYGRVRRAHDETTLRLVANGVKDAFAAGVITEHDVHRLNDEWTIQARKLGIETWWSVSAEPPVPEAIPLANLRRLDLHPGDRLAVILPDGLVSQRQMHEFTKRLQAQLGEIAPEMPWVVFPPGVELAALRVPETILLPERQSLTAEQLEELNDALERIAALRGAGQ